MSLCTDLTQVVRELQRSINGVKVLTEDGCVYEANYVVLSTSIGVLQSDLISFIPPLPVRFLLHFFIHFQTFSNIVQTQCSCHVPFDFMTLCSLAACEIFAAHDYANPFAPRRLIEISWHFENGNLLVKAGV